MLDSCSSVTRSRGVEHWLSVGELPQCKLDVNFLCETRNPGTQSSIARRTFGKGQNDERGSGVTPHRRVV